MFATLPYRSTHVYYFFWFFQSPTAETPEKIAFVWGESAPIWGRYGGLKFGFFGFLAKFSLFLLGTLSTDFRFFDYSTATRAL